MYFQYTSNNDMIINHTNIVLVLQVIDLCTEKIVFEGIFDDFIELNKELVNPSYEEPSEWGMEMLVCQKYDDHESILMGYEIDGFEMQEIEIEEYIEQIEEYLTPNNVQLTPEVTKDDGNKGNKNKADLATFEYVCPSCYESLEHCKCSNYPYFLVQIDKNILPIIKNLNLKGYQTAASCEGHEEDSVGNTMILFRQRYEFPLDYPAGGSYNGMANLEYRHPKSDIEEYRKSKKNTLEALEKWSSRLPEYLER